MDRKDLSYTIPSIELRDFKNRMNRGVNCLSLYRVQSTSREDRGTSLKEEGLRVKLRNRTDIDFIHTPVSHKLIYLVSYLCHDTGRGEGGGVRKVDL